LDIPSVYSQSTKSRAYVFDSIMSIVLYKYSIIVAKPSWRFNDLVKCSHVYMRIISASTKRCGRGLRIIISQHKMPIFRTCIDKVYLSSKAIFFKLGYVGTITSFFYIDLSSIHDVQNPLIITLINLIFSSIPFDLIIFFSR